MLRYTTIFCLLLAGCSDTVSSDPWTFTDEPDEPDEPSSTPAASPEQTADGSVEEPTEPPPTVEPIDGLPQEAPELWHGWWLVDQPSHALYEATYYEFQPGGILVQGDTYVLDTPAPDMEVGTVGKCAELHTETYEDCSSNGNACETREYSYCVRHDPICTFGDRWGSMGERTLLIEGDCSDGIPHVIELEFDAEADLQNGQWLVPQVRVEGEPWEHNWWDWAWHRCTGTLEECPPY